MSIYNYYLYFLNLLLPPFWWPITVTMLIRSSVMGVFPVVYIKKMHNTFKIIGNPMKTHHLLLIILLLKVYL